MPSRLLSLLLLVVAPLAIAAAPNRPNLVYPLQAQRPPVARTSQTWTWTLLPGTFNASSGSIITLSTRSLPPWASFDAATYTFSGMPTAEDVGTQYVTVQANVTGVAQGKTDSFRLLVVEGTGPVVGLSLATQLPNASSFGGGATYTADGALLVPPTWSFSLGFQQYTFETSPSYSRIYYTAYQTGTTELPYWLHFDNNTVTFDGVAPRQLGEVSITVYGSDYYGYGDLSETFQLEIGYHAFELLGSLPAINATQGANVSYTVPVTNLTINDRPVSDTNLSSISVDLSGATFLTYDAASRLISGMIPPTFAPGTLSLPITFVDSYTEKVVSNITLVVGPSHTTSSTSSGVGSSTSSRGGAAATPITGSDSGVLNQQGGLSNSTKIAIGLAVGLVGGVILLVLLLACCRRRSDKRQVRRDQSTLIFDQATIAAAQRGDLSEKLTGKSTFAAKFGMGAPTPSTGRTAVESPASKTMTKELSEERLAELVIAAPPPLTTASSKPRRLNLMGLLGRPASRRDISTISLPVPQSQNSLYGLGIGDAPSPHHKIVVVTDDYTETFVPESARGKIVAADSGLHRTSSWESRGSSSLFYSEGSDNDVSTPGGSNRRRGPTPDPSIPRQRRDFLPLPIRTSSQQAAALPHDPSFIQSSSSSSITAPASDGGIRLVDSQSISFSGSPHSDLDYSSSSLRHEGERPAYDPSSDSGHSIPPPRLIPFTKERVVSQIDPDPSRQASPASQRAQRNRESAMEDADEDAHRARPRSAVYLPPRDTGSPTTSAVYFSTPREAADEWGRSPSVSEYDAGEGVRLVSSTSGSPHLGVGRSSHTDSSYIRFNPQMEQGDDGEYRVVTY